MTAPRTLPKGFPAYGRTAQTQYPALEVLRGMVQEQEGDARRADLPSPSAAPDSGPPRITVLIPAHNEAATIAQTIRSLRQQSIPVASITVVCDNCTDDTAQIAEALGVHVMVTTGNTARKAGALNQALERVLPTLNWDDLVLTMDADSALSQRWLELASRTLRLDPMVGAVCGAFLGEPGAGIIGQLQRNEYFRYARIIQRRWQALVLSGTGTLFRVPVLRQVARERGLSLPGTTGQWYSHASITEDDEMTLAVKALGWKCLTVAQCETTTEVMPTVGALWTQRMRWQKGTLGDLHAYGLTKMTLSYWLRQVGLYGGFAVSYACLFILIGAVIVFPQFSVAWTGGVLSISVIERTWTVRRAGWRGMLLAALIVPEGIYSLWQGWLFFAAAVASLQRREIAWGHLAREATA
jgi:biofilm PGA synthesis N-glycosyltransferase PgaC